jgi:hypothetical protein
MKVATMGDSKTTQPAVERLRERFGKLKAEGLQDIKFWYVGGTPSEDVSVDDLCAEVNGLLDVVETKQFIEIPDSDLQ